MKKERGLVPDVGVVAETEEALLEGEHDSLGYQEGVLDLEGVGLLPVDVFLPELDL